MQRIFEKFRRGSNCGLRNVTGTGLGLTIAQEIIESHNGELKLTRHSNPTTFTIFMPIDKFKGGGLL